MIIMVISQIDVNGTYKKSSAYTTRVVHEHVVCFDFRMVLDAAYSIHDRVFFDNLGQILLHAVVVS